MGGAFEWLNKIFEYLGMVVPRPYLVIWTQRGIRYLRGKKPTLVRPGLHWYWPLTTLVKVINMTLRADEFEAHVYTTKDGKPIALGYTMLSRVTNPVKADLSTDNYIQTIGELGESVLSPIIASQTFQELLTALANDAQLELTEEPTDDAQQPGLNVKFTKEAHRMAKRFGVRVEYCRIHTFSPTRVIKLLGRVMPPQ